jgi:hypothetical protein
VVGEAPTAILFFLVLFTHVESIFSIIIN